MSDVKENTSIVDSVAGGGDASEHESPATPKKQKSKTPVAVNGNALANEDATVKVPAKAPKAPRKRKNAAQKDETPEGSSQKKPRGRGKKAAQIKAEDGDESGGDVQDTPTPSKRQAKGGLPKSLDEAKTEDKLLYEMKENGTAIGEVVKMWHRETGSSTTAKALHNRYYRLKDSFARIPPEDCDVMIEAAKQYEKDKMGTIAEIMSQKGTKQKYSTVLVTREYKRVMAELAAGTYKPAMSDDSAKANVNDDSQGSGDGNGDEDGGELVKEEHGDEGSIEI
ncbi:MAG: hypothetical protein MMC23_009050 [Stictis urceolatum]|nr:hypothetical protein [Stictis urceolata]